MRKPAFPPDGDTIAAVSTPFGVGGIGIVRISGNDAEKVVRRLFVPHRPKTSLPSHRLCYGTIRNPRDQTLVDEVLVAVMRAPGTYTREDVAEIQCHGGAVPVRRILELVLAEGVRLAEPGEFTRRAFFNGRIDLVQAEAVLDTVQAKSDTALRFAQRQLDGTFSREIRAIHARVRDLLVQVEAGLDFPEEDLPEPESSRLRAEISGLTEAVQELLDTSRAGHWVRDGVTVVIGGKPNVGKSTLLNALAGRERAIVSATPGTTRDFLEETLLIGGIPVRLVDTAGICESDEEVETRGVALARGQIRAADLVLWVLDASRLEREPFPEDFGSRPADRGPGTPEAPADESLQGVPADRIILVFNKVDLLVSPERGVRTPALPGLPGVPVCALEGLGLEALRETILARLVTDKMDLDSRVVVTNVRHRLVLEDCLAALRRAAEPFGFAELPADLLAQDLRQALRALGEILGETTPEEILRRIFDSFCVGK